MNNSKKTRRALLSSLVALMLCFSMFVGTTMAWFTDTATTGVNTIQAGTLDIDLLMDKDVNGNYVSIAGDETGIFTKAGVATNSNATLWEPGKTQVAYLAIENKGNLAAKYSVDILAVKPADATADMTKVMQYAITPDATEAEDKDVDTWDKTKAQSLNLGTTRATTDVAIDAGATHYFALSVHMDELAGNEYQGQSVEFYISVTATQNTVEEDSFGKEYDKDATYEETLAAGTTTVAEANLKKTIDETTGEVTKVTTTAETTVIVKNANDKEVATVTVPADTELENEAGSISVTVTPTEVNEKVVVTSAQGAKTYDIEVTGVAKGELVTVNLFVGKGLSNVELYHNDTKVNGIVYDSTSGIVTFSATSFSPYTVVYDAANDQPVVDVKEYTVKTKWQSGGTEIFTSADLSPVVTVMPTILGYSIFDGDTRITNEVKFCFSGVEKQAIDENSYKVSFNLAVKDENGNDLVLKEGRKYNPANPNDPHEYLYMYINLLEVPAGYSVSAVEVNGDPLEKTTNSDPATEEYMLGSEAKDVYLQTKEAGLVEVTLIKQN